MIADASEAFASDAAGSQPDEGGSQPTPRLRLDWCSYAAAKYAVTHWHYSRSLPPGKTVKIGVWEDDRFVGAVIFGRGATTNIGKPYRVAQTETCELVRVALDRHRTPVSRIGRIAVAMLRRLIPGLRLIVSYADPAYHHHGGIYQAMGWVYTGTSPDAVAWRDNAGRVWHPRQVSVIGSKPQFGRHRPTPKIADCERVDLPGKHRYYLPLDAATRALVERDRRPYPKRSE